MKASAGSGKTFSLSREYIRVLLAGNREEANYHRHILAVTFTNKATDNMKNAIVEALDLISRNPDKCPYSTYLMEECGFSTISELKAAAHKALVDILNDYSAFSVSTIDKFFQRTLKAFAREIGQSADYKVELDRGTIIDETVDSLLDSLTEEDKDLLRWLSDSSIEKLEAGEGYKLDSALESFANNFLSPEYDKKKRAFNINESKAFSEENLKKLTATCNRIISGYVKGVNAAAAELDESLNVLGFHDAVNRYLKGWVKEALDFDGYQKLEFFEKPTWQKMVQDASAIVSKDFIKKNKIDKSAFEGIRDKLEKLDRYGLSTLAYRQFNTACMLTGQVYVFRTAEALRKHHQNVLKERNVLGLDDTNEILRKLIGNTDVPFIYEKTGTRYKHFLLDEFQDTSNIQWECFRPLLLNSISEGCYNLIVGDVKQSIYRWRDAEWKIFGEQVERDVDRVHNNPLKVNWRSAENIVGFNNRFFKSMTSDPALANIYDDVEQEVSEVVKKKLGVKGCVDISICDSENLADLTLSSVNDALGRGYSLSDIAIIVRTNKLGGSIAEHLTNNGIRVVTDDSLRISNSSCVRKVISGLYRIDSPEDTINTYNCPDFDYDAVASCRSVQETADLLFKQLPAHEVNSQTLYVLAFMDLIKSHADTGGNSIHSFLEYWKDYGLNKTLSCPSGQDAVTIITIHKSKGIEYPFVIVPVKKDRTEDITVWDSPDTAGSEFSKCEPALYHVRLKDNTLFDRSLESEREMNKLDDANVWYVAFTRAKIELRIIADIKNNGIRESLEQFASDPDSGFVQLKQEEDSLAVSEYILGEPACRQEAGRKDEKSEDISIDYLEEGGSTRTAGIRISGDAREYFMGEGEMSPRKRGIILHGILEHVCRAADLEAAVDDAVCHGDLAPDQRESVFTSLSNAIEYVKRYGWFDEDITVLSEREIISGEESSFRPDRVVIKNDAIEIIDYKFAGYNKKYYNQVENYMNLYKAMGYEKVNGYIWYVDENKIIKIKQQ